jgi:nucleoside-diphosphate-sugar epimerase
MTIDLEAARAELAGRRVLVTGAGGFIGGRLADRLVRECGAAVRAQVRSVAGALRLARFPLEIVRGDVTDRGFLAAAVAGCDAVFHCAYGTRGGRWERGLVNREGTRRLLAAAARAGVGRAVHLSTLMVYGLTADGDLTEEAPRRRSGEVYADSKIAAERIALGFARRGELGVAVLQPTAVYGPFGGVWTARVLAELRTGRVILVDGGEGLANHVYVDDLVDAMLLAAVEPAAVGEAFLVSSAEPAPWRDFYACFERMLGTSRTVAMTAAEAHDHWRRFRRSRPRAPGVLIAAVRGDRELRERLFATPELAVLREAASTLLPEARQRRIKRWLGQDESGRSAVDAGGGEPPIHPLSVRSIDFFRARTRVRIDKAARRLGYRPAWDLDAGMVRTREWARWAELVP